ncbi:innexin shaking-B [Caerostris extrusa]|uniref:Innexin n=1 Tax=Caerostris extrusa TaxID=172846 RepID=A0AAV4R5Y0_CAEEX|nr:innexin shaking-B [Caerostris extrusa]
MRLVIVQSDEIPHPGIDSSQNPTRFRYYRYYQWVYFIFFLQAFMFYIPEWLWKIWEGQKIDNLVSSFEDVLLNETERRRKMDTIIRYLTKTWKMHYWYAMKYIFCEFLSLANVVGQMYLLDKFFDGRFKTFGIRVVQFSRTQKQFTTYSNTTLSSKWDPKIMLFPRVTKCIFRRYGKTSNIETYDALCIMTLNIISEKLFIFLWFWLVILAALSSINLLLNLILVVIPIFRTYALRLRLHHINFTKLHALIRQGNYGDFFFLLDLLSLNVDNILFTELVREISNELPGKQIVLQI